MVTALSAWQCHKYLGVDYSTLVVIPNEVRRGQHQHSRNEVVRSSAAEEEQRTQEVVGDQ